MKRMAGLLILTLPLFAAAEQPVMGPPLVGATTVVNGGPGAQTDPHVSGDMVAYTNSASGVSEVRAHDLLTGKDSAVSPGTGLNSAPDISGSLITFTHATSTASAIFVYDTATAGPALEVEPQPNSNRLSSAIGGGIVAWQDLGFYPDTLSPEIVVHELASGASARLTQDLLRDNAPAVSPDGSAVVWTKCSSPFSGCDVWSATRVNGVWSSRALTGTGGEEWTPDSNGVIAVYASTRNGESDIYWQPVAGGAEQQLVLPGPDRNPNIAGNLIAFEHFDESAPIASWDLYVYDVSTNTLYRLTQTPVNEELNDISMGKDGVVRVAWDAPGQADIDVFAFSFVLPDRCDDSGSERTPEEVCADPGSHPLVSIEVVRAKGRPDIVSRSFEAPAGEGILCLENHATTSGAVWLNGQQVVSPSAFKRGVELIAGTVGLQEVNEIEGRIGGAPGSWYEVRIYERPPACEDSARQVTPEALRVAGLSREDLRTVTGVPGVLASGVRSAASGAASSCSSTNGGLSLTGVIVLLGLLLIGRQRASSPERSSHGR